MLREQVEQGTNFNSIIEYNKVIINIISIINPRAKVEYKEFCLSMHVLIKIVQ